MSKAPQIVVKPLDRAAEIARLKSECEGAMSRGNWELAEAYHQKLIELEIPG